MIKTILTKVPHVHALIFKMQVFSANIKVVSRSTFYTPHYWQRFEDGSMNLIHSPHAPWRLHTPLFTDTLKLAVYFLVMSLQVAIHPETTMR